MAWYDRFVLHFICIFLILELLEVNLGDVLAGWLVN